MAPEYVRHSIAKVVLELFHPLFEYSSVARGGDESGEENLFRILDMNPGQALHAFYIAGGDHYHRLHPATHAPDTIQKLEEGMISRFPAGDGRRHRVSAVFLRRDGEEKDIPTFLDVRRLEGLPVQTCSTAIRQALVDRRGWWKLFTLPFVALASIRCTQAYRGRASLVSCDDLFPLLRDAAAETSWPPSALGSHLCPDDQFEGVGEHAVRIW